MPGNGLEEGCQVKMERGSRRDLLICLSPSPFVSVSDVPCRLLSLSLSLPFWVIWFLGLWASTQLLSICVSHALLPSLPSSGADSQQAGFPGRGGGCVWEEGVGWTVIVLAGSDAIGSPRLDSPGLPAPSFHPLLLPSPFISPPLPVPSESIRQSLL